MTRFTLIIFIGILLLAFNFKLNYVSSTPLDDYVYAPDSTYGYSVLNTYQLDGYTLYVLNFTSQKWFDETLSSQPIWWHYLCISVPTKITKPDVAFILVDGGSNGAGVPGPTDNTIELSSMFAASTGGVGVTLKQIPNEPIQFWKDPSHKNRDEDEIIAWTWKTFLENTSDPYILLRLPMTKAVVRCMDAVQNFTSQYGAKIERFMIAGASKRGWTTWTTAAVDKRVFIAVPMVLDLLNLNENLHHHFKSLGGWTFAFGSYHDLNITTHMDTPEILQMQEIVDPYYYLDRYSNITMMLITSSGDEFFLPDDTYYFWDQLTAATNGRALIRRLPNAEHSLAGHEFSIFLTLRSLFLSVYENQPLPRVKWIRPNNKTHGVIVATVDTTTGRVPFDAAVYYAKTLNDKRRDFRLLVANPNDTSKPMPHPVIWLKDKSIIQQTNTSTSISYEVAFPMPLSGWLGFFIQISFQGIDNSVLEVTTEVNIIPETFPFPDCTRDSCAGTLV